VVGESPGASDNVIVPADYELPAGTWAVVFGSEYLGASGPCALITNNTLTSEPLRMIRTDFTGVRNDGDWTSTGGSPIRIAVIAEPLSCALP